MPAELPSAAEASRAEMRPTGRRFVTARLRHPARNRLPRDFIRG